MRSSLLESVLVIEFQTTEAYCSFDLTIALYSIRRLSRVEKENVIVRINANNYIVHEKKMYVLMKMEFLINIFSQIIDTVSSQYRRITKSVLIIQYSRFPGKGSNSTY
jgi:hypothetical protein